MLYKALLALGAFAAAAAAQEPEASITITASHGGAGNDLTNTTIEVPIGQLYTDTASLNEVSYLYLTAATGVPVESITCTPYRYANGTGAGGLPFSYGKPSLLSTNTVQVGSLLCVSTAGNGTTTTTSSGTTTTPIQTITPPPGATCTVCADYVNSCGSTYGGCYDSCKTPSPTFSDPGCSSTSATTTPSGYPNTTRTSSTSNGESTQPTSSSPGSSVTSTYVTTVQPTGGAGGPSTITSVVGPSSAAAGGSSPAQGGATTSSESPSMQTGAAAAATGNGAAIYGAIAIGLLGVGAVL